MSWFFIRQMKNRSKRNNGTMISHCWKLKHDVAGPSILIYSLRQTEKRNERKSNSKIKKSLALWRFHIGGFNRCRYIRRRSQLLKKNEKKLKIRIYRGCVRHWPRKLLIDRAISRPIGLGFNAPHTGGNVLVVEAMMGGGFGMTVR